jgi:hypothetical protein
MVPSDIENALCLVLPRFPPDARWAVSCGVALTLHGLDYHPNDLDIFAGQADAARLAKALADLPTVFPYSLRISRELSSHWGRFLAGRVEIDIVGDFSVRRGGRVLSWNPLHPCWNRLDWISVRGVLVPIVSLPDLLALYESLPDEDSKVKLIRTALKHGVPRWA